MFEPIDTFEGKCIAIIYRKTDNKDILVITPLNTTFSNEQIKALTQFQERYYESEIIRSSNELIFNQSIPELSVTNLKESLKFYKTIGFKIEYERPENKFVFISLNQIQFMLQEISKDEKWSLAPLTYTFGNGINFQLDVKNLDEIYNNLKSANYKISFDIQENWYRKDNILYGSKEFLIQDPDGYLLRFAEDIEIKEAG